MCSKRSPFPDCRDVIYADPSVPLEAGHVRVNRETTNPGVTKFFREVDDPAS